MPLSDVLKSKPPHAGCFCACALGHGSDTPVFTRTRFAYGADRTPFRFARLREKPPPFSMLLPRRSAPSQCAGARHAFFWGEHRLHPCFKKGCVKTRGLGLAIPSQEGAGEGPVAASRCCLVDGRPAPAAQRAQRGEYARALDFTGGGRSTVIDGWRQSCTTISETNGTVWCELVEPRGIEPLTSCMPCRRSPS